MNLDTDPGVLLCQCIHSLKAIIIYKYVLSLSPIMYYVAVLMIN